MHVKVTRANDFETPVDAWRQNCSSYSGNAGTIKAGEAEVEIKFKFRLMVNRRRYSLSGTELKTIKRKIFYGPGNHGSRTGAAVCRRTQALQR